MPPRRVRELREALFAFRDVYVDYLDATVRRSAPAANAQELRREVSARIPKASKALRLSGHDFAIYPPPAAGPRAPVIHGLRNIAFVHESVHGVIGLSGPPSWQRLLDMIESSLAELEDRERAARRTRRNPLYWLDRGLRLVLGIPAYVLSLVFGVPLDTIEESVWGKALRGDLRRRGRSPPPRAPRARGLVRAPT